MDPILGALTGGVIPVAKFAASIWDKHAQRKADKEAQIFQAEYDYKMAQFEADNELKTQTMTLSAEANKEALKDIASARDLAKAETSALSTYKNSAVAIWVLAAQAGVRPIITYFAIAAVLTAFLFNIQFTNDFPPLIEFIVSAVVVFWFGDRAVDKWRG